MLQFTHAYIVVYMQNMADWPPNNMCVYRVLKNVRRLIEVHAGCDVCVYTYVWISRRFIQS